MTDPKLLERVAEVIRGHMTGCNGADGGVCLSLPCRCAEDAAQATLDTLPAVNLALIDTSPESVERMADAAFPMEFVPGMDRNIVVHAIRAALEAGKVGD